MVAEGVMSSEERETRLAEIHEHERDHREGMIDALQMTDEEWDEIKSSSEFQENMRQLQAMAEGFAEALKSIEFTADSDDPAANLLKRNLFGSVERLTGSLEDAARAADIPKLEPDGSARVCFLSDPLCYTASHGHSDRAGHPGHGEEAWPHSQRRSRHPLRVPRPGRPCRACRRGSRR
jgi:hypothetical protein